MLSAIGNFLQKHFAAEHVGESERDHTARVRLAAAALLVEVVRADHMVSDAERQSLLSGLAERFGLVEAEAAELLHAAEQHAHDATDLFQSTSQINRLFTEEEKRWLIEELWRAAYADAVLHRHEDYLIRKVADLIYIPHREMLAAKHRVHAQRQLDP